ncbi:MAG: substrate-binding domain-containing protein [Eubacteriales bacterium]|nr:substrate-binding domain-containing protein [Eubacteriales bacterium]
MGRFLEKRRVRAKGRNTNPGYRSVRAVKSVSNYSATRSRRKQSGFLPFIKRNYKIIAIASFAAVAAVIGIVLIFGGKDTTATSAQVDATSTVSVDIGAFDETQEYSYEGVDESVLGGLAGTDESLFSEEDQAIADALFAETGIRIGVTIGNIETDNDEILLGMLEEVACAAEEDKIVYKVYYYNAGGDYNQQLQDVRSLLKNEVDVIIAGSTSQENFEMVSYMAEEAGIPVVAYDAPVSTGYAINVVADQETWGEAYGAFMAENLAEGNIVQILGNEESGIDSARAGAINQALAANANIATVGTTYALWQETAANEAMAAYLSGSDQIDGVITEEGMAEGIIDAFIEEGVLPKVMCGDATAGFIKKWYALLNGGVDITPEDADEDDEKVMFTAEPGAFIVCAQPAPTSISAVAFELALKLAEGCVLKSEGMTFEYALETFITEDNLSVYYEMIKDQDDSYVVRDVISDEMLESLFEEPQEETE